MDILCWPLMLMSCCNPSVPLKKHSQLSKNRACEQMPKRKESKHLSCRKPKSSTPSLLLCSLAPTHPKSCMDDPGPHITVISSTLDFKQCTALYTEIVNAICSDIHRIEANRCDERPSSQCLIKGGLQAEREEMLDGTWTTRVHTVLLSCLQHAGMLSKCRKAWERRREILAATLIESLLVCYVLCRQLELFK